jgi:hypothetical protein
MPLSLIGVTRRLVLVDAGAQTPGHLVVLARLPIPYAMVAVVPARLAAPAGDPPRGRGRRLPRLRTAHARVATA